MKKAGWAAGFFVMIFVLALKPSLRLDDLFLYLALGRLQASGGIPALDPFLFTIPEHHWHPWHEWLSFRYYFAIFDLAGYPGIIFGRALIATSMTLLIYVASIRRGISQSLSMLIAGTAVAAAAPRAFHDRSSNFSDLFCLVLLSVLFSAKPARLRWFLPLLFAVWVNVHSSYIFGWFFLSLFIIFQKQDRPRWVLCGLLCGLATLLNPQGLEGALWPVRAVFASDWGVLGKIVEFEPVWSTETLSPVYKIFFALLTALTLALSFRARAWFPFFCACVLAALGWRYVRMVGLSGFGLGLVTASVVPAAWNLRRFDIAASGAILLAGFGLCLIPRDPSWPLHNTVPVQAVEFLKTRPPGKVFNEWQAGGFLAWELDSRWKIAAHGFVSDPALAESQIYRATVTREDWQRIVIDGGVRYFFLRRQSFEEMRQAAWVRELEGPGWRPVFADGAAIIFQRGN